MITETEHIPMIPDIEKYRQQLTKETPDWVNELRDQGLKRFAELGVPTVKNEEWKYTNLSALTERRFHLTTETELIEKSRLLDYYDRSEINIVLVNGVFSAELSNLAKLPNGVTVTGLTQALKNDNGATALFKKFPVKDDDSFAALNSALMREGVFVKIDDKVVLKDLIHIVHVTSTKERDIATFPKSIITLGRSSEASVLESHIGFGEKGYFADPVTDIFLKEDAKLLYCKAQSENKQSFHIGTTRVEQEANSQFHGFSMMTGAKLTRNNLNIALNGEGASATLNGLYIIAEDQHADNHTAVDHRVPNCTSNQLYKGILNDSSRSVFNGKIFVRPIAQKTNSYQLNKNLLLGKDCRVDTKPQLEIFADDVKCTHGATIGQLNDEEVFYLQTRAIPRTKAVKMLARGFVDDILNTIPSDAIRRKLNKFLKPTFLGNEAGTHGHNPDEIL
jgi:Fe-S cluster assembly protein SufD